MGQVTVEPSVPPADIAGPVSTATVAESFADLPNEMLKVVASSQSKESVLAALAETISARADLEAVLFIGRASDGNLVDQPQTLSGTGDNLRPLAGAVHAVCAEACATGSLEIRLADGNLPRTIVAVPVIARGQPPEALCAIPGDTSTGAPERVGEMLQFAAAHLTLWYVLQGCLRAEQEAKHSAALLEFTSKVESCGTLDEACITLVNELQPYLACRQIVVGLRRGRDGYCQLRAVSGHARFDKHSEFAKCIEAALDESLLVDKLVRCPDNSGPQTESAQAHAQLRSALGAECVISSPLYDERGRATGAWIFVDPRDDAPVPIAKFVQASSQQIGTCLRLVQQSQPGLVKRAARLAWGRSRRHRIACAVAALALVALMCLPRPHKIVCDGEVQPVVRRFVAAPYDGTLAETLVKPGDVVALGQVLAKMDGREFELELSRLEAEHNRARKAWESALSEEEISEAQQAHLEMKQIDLQMQLLRRRQQHLQIRSPLEGIVVRGDLEKSEGAPLAVGTGLFEIAPLQRMKVGIAIPEEEIAYVATGMEVRIRLDAYPRRPYEAKITTIVPRAEERDDQMVFMSEVELDNADGHLRPGMNGRATVRGPHRPLGWLLFHKPVESLLIILGW